MKVAAEISGNRSRPDCETFRGAEQGWAASLEGALLW